MFSRPAALYVVGVLSIGFAVYQFWHDGSVNQQAFLIGGVCVATAAGIQIIRDLWGRIQRR
jgi:hypothetical protein